MKLLLIAPLILLFIINKRCSANINKGSGPLPPMNFMHRVVMDAGHAYVLLWTPLEEKIIIEVQVSPETFKVAIEYF